MKTEARNQLFKLLVDAVIDGDIIVFDMKNQSLESPCDVSWNGPAVQITINPVVDNPKRDLHSGADLDMMDRFGRK